MTSEPKPFEMTTMDDLPENVLRRICKYIDWDCTVAVALPLSKIASMLKTEYVSLYFDEAGGYKILPYDEGHGASRPYVLLNIDKSGKLGGVFCPAIKSVRIQARLFLSDYNVLAQRLQNLCALQIAWRTLETVGRSEAYISFPKLRQLNLGGPDCFGNGVSNIKSNTGGTADNFGGLISILNRAYFPNLKHMGLSMIFEARQEKLFVNSLLTFLIKHQKTLKDLTIVIANDENADEKSEDWDSIPDFENRLAQLQLNLSYFFLHFYPYYESKTFLELIDRISLIQTSIEYHLLLYPRFQTFYTNLLEDNYKTLTCVALSIWIFESLNCQVFSQCSKLQKLMLHARPKKLDAFEIDNYRSELATSELTNILDLPKTLKVIVLINAFIETKDNLHFDQFPNLKFLSLQGIGEKDNLGFSLELFGSLTQREILVEIYRGFNRKLMQVNEQDDEATTIIKLTLLNYWKSRGKSHVLYLSSDPEFDALDLHSCARGTLPEVIEPDEEVEGEVPYLPIKCFVDGTDMKHIVYQGQSQDEY